MHHGIPHTGWFNILWNSRYQMFAQQLLLSCLCECPLKQQKKLYFACSLHPVSGLRKCQKHCGKRKARNVRKGQRHTRQAGCSSMCFLKTRDDQGQVVLGALLAQSASVSRAMSLGDSNKRGLSDSTCGRCLSFPSSVVSRQTREGRTCHNQVPGNDFSKVPRPSLTPIQNFSVSS